MTYRDVLWGYVAQALNIGAGLILLPVIIHHLSPADVGLWFVFLTLASLAQLLELGFQPTISRNVAYIYAGATNLSRWGLPAEVDANGVISVQLLANLIDAAQKIYLAVASIATVLLLVGGSYYISTLLTPEQDKNISLGAWVAFAGGYIVTFYYGYLNGVLQGRGDITQANKAVIVSRTSLIILGAAAVIAGFGLLGLGIASMVASVIGRLVAKKYFFDINRMEMIGIHRRTVGDNSVIRSLWHNASRLGLVQLGAFFIQRGNILIASSVLGLSVASSYSMTITLFMALSSVAMVACNVNIPRIASLQARGDMGGVRIIYKKLLVTGLLVFFVGTGFLAFFGESLLGGISSNVRILGDTELWLLGVIFMLELNHGIAATYLTTRNEVPFVRAALYSGAAIFLLGLLLTSSVGVLGLIAAQGVVQLMYNNWKWPCEALRHLHS